MEQIIRSTVTSKGQVTLPKVIRERLRAVQCEQIEFILDGHPPARSVWCPTS